MFKEKIWRITIVLSGVDVTFSNILNYLLLMIFNEQREQKKKPFLKILILFYHKAFNS